MPRKFGLELQIVAQRLRPMRPKTVVLADDIGTRFAGMAIKRHPY